MALIVDFPNQQKPNNVSFADDLEIKFIENLALKHKPSLWYTSVDIHSFKYETAVMMRNIKSTNMTMSEFAEMNVHDTSIFMGLECYLSDNTPTQIKLQRESIRRAVLAEQRRQLREDTYDPDAMSEVSMEQSEWSRTRAQVIGLLHADEDERRSL